MNLVRAAPPAPAAQSNAPIRVMICDDSAVVRAAIGSILSADPAIRVVARVANGTAALGALQAQQIDVVVLDIEMPVMDGLTALPLLLAAAPGLSIIMASTATKRGAEISLRALRLGAADYLPKPDAGAGDGFFGAELLAKVHGLARLRQSRQPGRAPGSGWVLRAPGKLPPQLLAIGSSTGGPAALFALAQQLGRRVTIPMVLTQHMPPIFTASLAQHIARLGGPTCSEAQEGEELRPGHILVAPGDKHLLIRRHNGRLIASLAVTPPENFCRPSVDPMLRSATEAVEGRMLIATLTGMGQDGLEGSRQAIAAGGTLIAQDEATSVVWGMPGAVTRAGLAHAVLPLPQIGAKLLALIDGRAA